MLCTGLSLCWCFLGLSLFRLNLLGFNALIVLTPLVYVKQYYLEELSDIKAR